MGSFSSTGDAKGFGDEQQRLITDFSDGGANLGWYVLNDDVMGGRSSGSIESTSGTLLFTGNTNTIGGGFSSIRTESLRLDLSESAGIRLHIKADGRRYSWGLTTDVRWRGREVGYWAEFDTLADTWTTVHLPFSRFVPRFRGSRLNAPALNAARISGMRLMIYDGQDGPFRVVLDSIHAYGGERPFTLARFHWEKRVLVISAPDAENADLVAQRRAIEASADEFADRDMALVVLLERGASSAGDRELTAEEADRARSELGIESGSFAVTLIGKDGTVKLSRTTATPMTAIYGLIDTMPMRRREQAEAGD